MTLSTAIDPQEASSIPEQCVPLNGDELRRINAYWRAANYLSVGQIYLLHNPLLHEPLKREHIKPRLLGHWGTTPGLNFVYVHLNRVIKSHGLNAIYIAGPGHGGPGIVANTYLEGTYSEVYPDISRDADGMQRLFKQFSFPGGTPAMSPRKPPAPSTKGANWAMPCRTPTGPPSITPTFLSVASSVTARPKPALWRQAGTPTSS